MKNKIAILILTYNEESNIKDCIETAKFADEIIVIDSGSSDNTKAIAESMGNFRATHLCVFRSSA